MSRLYGNAIQACFLVDDLDKAIAYWTEQMGAGPFFTMPIPTFGELHHRGAPAERKDIIAGVALGQSGDLQIELIVPGEAPSTYRDFLAAGGRGLHHFGMATRDYDADRAAALAAGFTVATEGCSQRTRIAYLDPPPGAPGPVIELIEMSEAITTAFDKVREASIGWDGSDPVRAL